MKIISLKTFVFVWLTATVFGGSSGLAQEFLLKNTTKSPLLISLDGAKEQLAALDSMSKEFIPKELGVKRTDKANAIWAIYTLTPPTDKKAYLEVTYGIGGNIFGPQISKTVSVNPTSGVKNNITKKELGKTKNVQPSAAPTPKKPPSLPTRGPAPALPPRGPAPELPPRGLAPELPPRGVTPDLQKEIEILTPAPAKVQKIQQPDLTQQIGRDIQKILKPVKKEDVFSQDEIRQLTDEYNKKDEENLYQELARLRMQYLQKAKITAAGGKIPAEEMKKLDQLNEKIKLITEILNQRQPEKAEEQEDEEWEETEAYTPVSAPVDVDESTGKLPKPKTEEEIQQMELSEEATKAISEKLRKRRAAFEEQDDDDEWED